MSAHFATDGLWVRVFIHVSLTVQLGSDQPPAFVYLLRVHEVFTLDNFPEPHSNPMG